MAYQIDNAIVKKDKNGNLILIDPEGHFRDEDAFIAIKSDDLITIQLLVNAILTEPIKTLLPRLGYSKEDIAQLLKGF